MKAKSLADFIDKACDPGPDEHDTFAQDNLKCPFCGHTHEPEDLNIKKQTQGTIKCSSCGEAFSFEVVKKVTYTTWPDDGKS